MRTDHSAAAVLGLPAWKKYNVTLDHPCVPIDNVVRNNCWTSVAANPHCDRTVKAASAAVVHGQGTGSRGRGG